MNPEVSITPSPNAAPGWDPYSIPPMSPDTGMGAPTTLPPTQQLTRNPMLPQHPLGAYTDATYEANMAQYAATAQKAYNDILQKLGYTDDQGNFILGSEEVNANRQRTDAARNQALAAEDVTHQMQQAGTLFSGYRGTQQARAEYPFANQIAQIGADLPVTLQNLYDQAGGVLGDYVNNMNTELANAAARRSAALTQAPGGPDTTPPAPTPDPTVNPPAPFTPVTPESTSNPGATQAVIDRSSGLADYWAQHGLNQQTGVYTPPHQTVADVHKATLNALQKMHPIASGHPAPSSVPSSIGSFVR